MQLIHHLDGVKRPHSLTSRQGEFCLQYVLTANKAKAARLSGYARRNSSSIGCRLLKRQDIQDYVRALRLEAARKSETPTTADLVDDMQRSKNETVASLADLFSVSDGVLRLRDPRTLNAAALSLADGFEFDSDGGIAGYRLNPNEVGPAFTRLMTLAGRT